MVRLLLLFALALPALSVPLTERALSFTTQFLGNYTTNPNDNSTRDLGFSGKIGSTVINSFGDTFKCTDAVHQTGCLGPEANSAGIGLSPTTFKDTPDPTFPNQFCKYFSDEDPNTWGMGITNSVPISSTAGILYFLSIRRNLPYNAPAIGAGVANVTFDSNGNPVCTRLSHNWWNGLTEPWYGDHSAFLTADGAYIHAMGGCNTTNAGGNYLFMSRVPVGQATNMSAYQYWNGITWNSARITAKQQYALVDVNNTPITDQGQGQVKYNQYLGQYIYLDRAGLNYNVRIRTSGNPQGPWSAPVNLFNSNIGGCSGIPYSPTIETYWYSSDQSIVVHFTCSPNIIQAVKVTFS